MIHAWVFVVVDGVTYPWAGVATADPIEYEHGYKEARLLLVDDLALALSDRRGTVQSSRALIEISDLPDANGQTLFRKWLADGKQLRGAEITIKLVSETERRLESSPMVVFRGVVKRYNGAAGFKARFECEGTINAALSATLVTDTIGAHFPSAPADVRDLPLPVLLGKASDEASATAAPVTASESARGVVSAAAGGGVASAGFGTCPGTPATSVVLTENLGAGFMLNGQKIRAQVYAFHGTVMADPAPFLDTGAEIWLTADNSAVTVSWTAASGGATKYRVVIGSCSNAGVFYAHQYLETTGTSVQFTHESNWDVFPIVLSPGATAVNTEAMFWDKWTAVMADGETVVSANVFSTTLFDFNRPRRSVINPVTGALYYYFNRTSTGKRLLVEPSHLNGDGNVYVDYTNAGNWESGAAWLSGRPATPKGLIRPMVIGPMTGVNGANWGVVAVYAAHACDCHTMAAKLYTVDNEGQDNETVTPVDPAAYGVTALAPGQTGWSAFTGGPNYWTDSQGTRWMVVGWTGPGTDEIIAGTKSLRVNAYGAEPAGDGSGTVITSIISQLAHLVDNFEPFAPSSALGRNWNATVPAFSDGTLKRDSASFTLAASNAAAVMPEGIEGVRWLTQSITWAEVFQEILRSGHLLAGVNLSGQLQVVFPNPAQTPAASVSEVDEVLRDSFSFQDTDDGFATIQPYTFGPRYGENGSMSLTGSGTLTDQSVSSEKKKADNWDMPWKTNALQAKAVAQLVMQESRGLPRTVPMSSGIHWVSYELGDILSVTHSEGPGYTDKHLQILGMRINVMNFRVDATMNEPRVVGTDGYGNSL